MAYQPVVQSQVSAGGVAFRQRENQIEIVLICVGEAGRWQLPKGLVDPGETFEGAAVREVSEEGGVRTELVSPIETIDYWYVGGRDPQRTRFHKFVHFFLLRYLSGDPEDHDHEVREARWVALDRAEEMLAHASEKKVIRRARELLGSRLSAP